MLFCRGEDRHSDSNNGWSIASPLTVITPVSKPLLEASATNSSPLGLRFVAVTEIINLLGKPVGYPRPKYEQCLEELHCFKNEAPNMRLC